MAQNQKLSFIENFMLSGVAAVTSKTIAAPIERVKLLIQNQDEMIKQGRLSTPYKGMVDCTTRVLAEEGVGPFWRGNMANVVRYFPTQALNFAFKDKIKAAFKVPKSAGTLQKLGSNLASGGIAGAMSLCFVYSLDFARTRLANDAKGKDGKRQFNGLVDVYRKTLATDGIAGLYRGFAISCVGIVVYRGFYFGLYDTISEQINSENFAVNFAVGYAVTVVSGILSYPIDTIRRRMMMTSGTGVTYNGAFDCAGQIMKAEGIGSFFKGAGANILRGVAGAGVLAGFSEVKKIYKNMKYGGK
jgi:solute carrier family 25 (adenine nucleotide translocator) protein 4/5/6/31